MNQKLSDWASIAEIASGIAVVVTLVVLMLGIRENTESVRASAFASNINALNAFQSAVLTDGEALRVWNDYLNGDSADLNELDERRLSLIVLTLFNIYENAYYFDRYGLIGEKGWERFNRNLCGFFGRVQSTTTGNALRQTMSREFYEHITNQCSAPIIETSQSIPEEE
jgi:hypothetical protein